MDRTEAINGISAHFPARLASDSVASRNFISFMRYSLSDDAATALRGKHVTPQLATEFAVIQASKPADWVNLIKDIAGVQRSFLRTFLCVLQAGKGAPFSAFHKALGIWLDPAPAPECSELSLCTESGPSVTFTGLTVSGIAFTYYRGANRGI